MMVALTIRLMTGAVLSSNIGTAPERKVFPLRRSPVHRLGRRSCIVAVKADGRDVGPSVELHREGEIGIRRAGVRRGSPREDVRRQVAAPEASNSVDAVDRAVTIGAVTSDTVTLTAVECDVLPSVTIKSTSWMPRSSQEKALWDRDRLKPQGISEPLSIVPKGSNTAEPSASSVKAWSSPTASGVLGALTVTPCG